MSMETAPTALATRQPFERHPSLAAHIQRMANTGNTGSMEDWCGFLSDLNATLSTEMYANGVFDGLMAAINYLEGYPSSKEYGRELRYLLREGIFGPQASGGER